MLFMIKGIIPAIVLPMDSNAEPDYDEYEKYIKWLCSAKITGIAVNVDTGEGPTLTEEEKTQTIRVAKRSAGNIKVVAGVIGTSTASAVSAARRAKEAGADMGLVFPNTAFSGLPLDPEGPLSYHRSIVEKSGLDIILFQLQSALGGIEYPLDTLLKLGRLEHVVAIKEASFDARKFLSTLRAFKKELPNVSFLTGNDNFIYESFVLGADGALVGFGAVAAKDLVEMFELVQKGRIREAGEIWDRLLPLADVIYGPPVRNYRARTKYALAVMGVISEETTYVRPPLLNVTRDEKENIAAALKKAELL